MATIQELPGEDGKPGRLFRREVARVRMKARNVRRRTVNREMRGPDGGSVTQHSISGYLRLPRDLHLGVIIGRRADDYSGEIPFVIDDRSNREGGLQVMDRHPNITAAICIGPERFAWLWQELLARPQAELSIDIEFRAYRTDEEQRRVGAYFLADGLGEPLLGATFRVDDPRPEPDRGYGRELRLPTFRSGGTMARAGNMLLPAGIAIGLVVGVALTHLVA